MGLNRHVRHIAYALGGEFLFQGKMAEELVLLALGDKKTLEQIEKGQLDPRPAIRGAFKLAAIFEEMMINRKLDIVP